MVNKETILPWLAVVVICFASAFYLNWIAYGPAKDQDGTILAVLRLGVKWYGIPVAIVIQLAIWWAMPKLFQLAPSYWIAGLVWPFLSAVSKLIILWPQQRPEKGDWFAIGGMFIALLTSIIWRD